MTERDPLQLAGTTLAEKYQIERMVGEGGFAVVYRARHVIWEQPVAIKFFNGLSSAPEEQREELQRAFIQEGALLTELSSQTAGIVQARDVGTLTTPSGRWMPYMVLEWLDGCTLEELLEQEQQRALGAWSVGELIGFYERVLPALDVAHARGIAHRDLKPANLFVLGKDGRSSETPIKLLDFGVAKMVGSSQLKAALAKTGVGITSFTPQYGAPEQFTRSYGATGPWTDVYAMALVGVELLCGSPALQGEDLIQLGFATANTELRPTPRARGVNIPDALEGVFAKALAVSPSERYVSAAQFLRAARSAIGLSSQAGVNSSAPARLDSARAPTLPQGAALSLPQGHGAPPSHGALPSPPAFSAPAAPASRPDPSARASTVLPAVTPEPRKPEAGGGFSRLLLGLTLIAAGGYSLHAFRPDLTAPVIEAGRALAGLAGPAANSGVGAPGAAAERANLGPGVAAPTPGTPGEPPTSSSESAALPGAESAALGGDAVAKGAAAHSATQGAASPLAGDAPAQAGAGGAAGACPPGMLFIAGGEFTRGSSEGVASEEEKPAHQVTLSAYCIDVTEVTAAAYQSCYDAKRCKLPSNKPFWPNISQIEFKAHKQLCTFHKKSLRQHPINCVTWQMAHDYCRAVGKRLPTEAEWELAARGPKPRNYPWGEDEPTAQHLNACDARCAAWRKQSGVVGTALGDGDDGFANTAPVGSYPRGASGFGALDMAGNVREWVADWYAAYAPEPAQDPKGPAEGERRVLRGSAWDVSYPTRLRPSFRGSEPPVARSPLIGFRCAADPGDAR